MKKKKTLSFFGCMWLQLESTVQTLPLLGQIDSLLTNRLSSDKKKKKKKKKIAWEVNSARITATQIARKTEPLF